MKTNRDIVAETARRGMRANLIDAQAAIQRAKLDMEESDLPDDSTVSKCVCLIQEHISSALRQLREMRGASLADEAEKLYDPEE